MDNSVNAESVEKKETTSLQRDGTNNAGNAVDDGLYLIEVTIKPCDFVTFPQGLDCIWSMKKPIRKHYSYS